MIIDLDNLVSRFQEKHPQRAPVPFRDHLADIAVVFTVTGEFLGHYKKIETDFIYDKTTGLFLVGFVGQHVDLMAALYTYYTGIENTKYEAADQYVLSGLGLLKSRAGTRIYRGANFVVPPELSPLARDIEVLK